jgi:hypothetical protein
MVHTVPLCPLYVPRRSPLWENQTLMTSSFEQEKRRSPSLLNFICVKERSWPAKNKWYVGTFEQRDRLIRTLQKNRPLFWVVSERSIGEKQSVYTHHYFSLSLSSTTTRYDKPNKAKYCNSRNPTSLARFPTPHLA